MPYFAAGGQVELMKYLASNIKYPKDAANAGKQGRVIVRFVVNEDGSISDETLIRGVFPSLDEEALRVINGTPVNRMARKSVCITRFPFPLYCRLPDHYVLMTQNNRHYIY